LVTFEIASVASTIANIVTHPFDVIKTQQQCGSSGQASLRAVVSELVQQQGPSAFMRGLLPRLAQSVPASALFLVLYEQFRQLFLKV
jgi:hypothetical protein